MSVRPVLYNTFFSTFHSSPHANNQGRSLLLQYIHSLTPSSVCAKKKKKKKAYILYSTFCVADPCRAIQTHTHMLSTYSHTMQYGKGITTGLILEPAHRQGELETTEEGRGKKKEERTSVQKQTALPNLTLSSYTTVFVCFHVHTLHWSQTEWWKKRGNGAHVRTCINTHLN